MFILFTFEYTIFVTIYITVLLVNRVLKIKKDLIYFSFNLTGVGGDTYV